MDEIRYEHNEKKLMIFPENGQMSLTERRGYDIQCRYGMI